MHIILANSDKILMYDKDVIWWYEYQTKTEIFINKINFNNWNTKLVWYLDPFWVFSQKNCLVKGKERKERKEQKKLMLLEKTWENKWVDLRQQLCFTDNWTEMEPSLFAQSTFSPPFLSGGHFSPR